MRVDHAKPKSEFQAEQVQGVFGGPQASSCEDANIVVIKTSPGASNQCRCLLFWKFYFMIIWLGIKSIEIEMII
jgi:hypothetical protein